jgi:hypothetical protein
MQVASRPRFTAGVAAVGASLVVASTVAPVPDIHLPVVHLPSIRTAEVNLAAAVNPLAIYSQVLHDALTNATTLMQSADPGLVLKQILANQSSSIGGLGAALGATGGSIATTLTQVPGLVQSAVGQLAAGNVSGAANTLLGIPLALGLPLTNLVPALSRMLTQPLENIVNVVKAFTSDTLGTELILSGFIAPLISTPAAAAVAVQNVISSVGTFNPAAIASALVAAPATIADGLLNGGFGPDLGPLTGVTGIIVKAGGLLSSSSLGFDSSGNIVVGTGGPIAALQQVLQKIAGALAPQALTAAKTDAASVPSTAATTVTLNTGSSAVSLPAKSTPSAEPAASDSTGTDTTKPADTDTPKDSSAASGTTPATSTGTESDSTTKDSTTKPDSTDASGSTTDTGTDAPTGTKDESHDTAGSGATKPGDAAGSATSHETGTDSAGAKGNATSGNTSKGADKGGHKHAHAASHAHASK